MSFSIGEKLRLTVFGQSHANMIGVIIDGLPAGLEFPADKIHAALDRRRPGKHQWTTSRQEEDLFTIQSGIVNNRTCGAPVCLTIANKDQRSQYYDQMVQIPRPSHADYPAYVKYQGYSDVRGGGHFSGRMTAPIVMAGAWAQDILTQMGISIYGHIASIGDIQDRTFDPVDPPMADLAHVSTKEFPVMDDHQGQAMQALILEAKEDQDSVGGQVEVIVTGLPVGLGRPLYDSCESKLAHAIFGVPAIRGIEFGTGFAASKMRGSQHNDPYHVKDGCISTMTNHHGGIIGGLTSGMPLVFRVAVKPTSSIGKSQASVNLETFESQELIIEGRHDPCIVPRVVPVLEAMTAITLLDLVMMEGLFPFKDEKEGAGK